MDHEIAAWDYRIMLQSGNLFDLAFPESCEIHIDDIAHGLAHTCRYAGQCDGFYSVAEHSVHVSRVVTGSRLVALMHDAAEAFVGDMPSPLKRMLPEFEAIEIRIERAIFAGFSLPWPPPQEVKRADYRVMAAELPVLMPPGTNLWLRDLGVVPADIKVMRLGPSQAKALFLERYEELTAAERRSATPRVNHCQS